MLKFQRKKDIQNITLSARYGNNYVHDSNQTENATANHTNPRQYNDEIIFLIPHASVKGLVS